MYIHNHLGQKKKPKIKEQKGTTIINQRELPVEDSPGDVSLTTQLLRRLRRDDKKFKASLDCSGEKGLG